MPFSRFSLNMFQLHIRIVLTCLFMLCNGSPFAQEVYYDQFDWGGPNDLNTQFWGSSFSAEYLPDEPTSPTLGAVRLRRPDQNFSEQTTQPLTSLIPGNDYTFYARILMRQFDDGDSERNAEIAFRTDGLNGYMLTLDGGQDIIRLRRSGAAFEDLVPPVEHEILPGDIYYFRVTVQGTDPVQIDATVAESPDFSNPLFAISHSEGEWIQNNETVELIGFTDEGAYTFDFDYFSIGLPGYEHPLEYWTRTGYTNAPPEPPSSTLGNLDSYEVLDDRVILNSDVMKVALVPRLNKTVRVDFAPTGVFPEFSSYAVTRTDWPEQDFTVTDGQVLLIEGLDWKIEVEKTPIRLRFLDGGGNLLAEEAPGLPMRANGETRRLAFTLDASDDIYGLGQHDTDGIVGLSRRGHQLRIDNRHEPPAIMLFPFWVSPLSYGVFVDNPSDATIDVGATAFDRVVYTSDFGELQYYFFFGNCMADVLDQYTQVTGRPALAPRWTFGNIQSKYGYESFDEIQSIINEFRNRSIPLDSIIIDLFWFGRETMGNLEFQNTSNWANPTQRLAGFRDQGIKIIPITEPQISGLSFNASEVLNQSLVATESDGVTPAPGADLWWITNAAPVYILDFTKQAARDWWIEKHQKLIEDYQFDGFWQDLNEPEGVRDDMTFADGPAPAVHNAIAICMNRALVEAMEQYAPGKRPYIMSRSGYAGMQKYGASIWSGDVAASWFDLNRQGAIGLSANLAGIPYWNSDIGGFNGNPTPELYLRWCQFGLFNPVYRPHGAFSDREPWRFGTDVENAVRDVLELRYRLLPYYYTIARESYDTGMPIMRPLVMEWPNDPAIRVLGSQWLYGPSLMGAPITQENVTARDVYLPDGTWYDWFDGTRFEGPITDNFTGSVDEFPLYVRAPAIIPMAPLMQTSDESPLDEVMLRVYAPQNTTGTGNLYEDDGLTLGYQQDEFAITDYETRWPFSERLQLSISAIDGTFIGLVQSRDYTAEFFDVDLPLLVKHNAVELPSYTSEPALEAVDSGWFYDDAQRRLIVAHPVTDTDQAQTLTIDFAEVPTIDSEIWTVY